MISGVSLPIKLAKKAKCSSMRKIPQCENKQEIPRGARLRVRLELGSLSVGLLGSSSKGKSDLCGHDI